MIKTIMTLYILVWPAMSAAILALLVFALVRDIRAARQNGRNAMEKPRFSGLFQPVPESPKNRMSQCQIAIA